jgi:hypothetical protein
MKFLKLLALSASVLSIPAMAADTPATVTIETGALRGVVADGVASWKGILCRRAGGRAALARAATGPGVEGRARCRRLWA